MEQVENLIYIFATGLTPSISYIGSAKVSNLINNETINRLIKNGFNVYFKTVLELNEKEIQSIDLVYKE